MKGSILEGPAIYGNYHVYAHKRISLPTERLSKIS